MDDISTCPAILRNKSLEMAINYLCTEGVRTLIQGGTMATVFAPVHKEVPLKTSERIDVRLRPEQKNEIERAAHIKGLTVTDFILQNAVANARQAIREHETWTIERSDAEIFAAALIEPASLGPQLAQAAIRYKRRFLPR
ncbi:MAG: DUF1778 domain-containing protein [Terracidiphilus sp.]